MLAPLIVLGRPLLYRLSSMFSSCETNQNNVDNRQQREVTLKTPPFAPHRSMKQTGLSVLQKKRNASRGYLYLKYAVVIINIPCGFPYFDAEASLKPLMWGPASKLQYGFEFIPLTPSPSLFYLRRFADVFITHHMPGSLYLSGL